MAIDILTLRGIQFEIQKELNTEIYAAIEGDSEFLQRTFPEPAIDLFVKHRQGFLSDELITFLREAGVDHKKDNEIFHYALSGMTVISGWFDIIGRIVGADKTETFVLENGDSTINFRFSHHETYGQRTEFKPHSTFRLSFDLVLH